MILRGPIIDGRAGAQLLLLTLFFLAGVGELQSQTGTEPTLTLHAYANLVQLPTLVLDSRNHPLPNLDANVFELSLDSGRTFPPSHVRLEGEDPIELAILLDLSGSQESLLKGFPDTVANLVPGSLHPQDRVWVYAVKCSLIRYAGDVNASQPLLHRVLTDAIARSSAETAKNDGSCMKPAPLWAVISTVVHQIEGAPGRRVVLVLSDGVDGGSKYGWPTAHYFAGTRGVALFGLIDVSDLRVRDFTRDPVPRDFRQLCESSGGIVMESSPKRLPAELVEFVNMLRGRYILEFPSPQHMASGTHSVDVRLRRKKDVFVAAAGVTVAMRDPNLLNDPTTIPSQAGADIPVGDKRPDIPR